MKFKYFVIALFLIAQSCSMSPKIGARNTGAETQKEQQRIRQYLLSKHVNGSIAVVKKDKVIFNEGIGLANRANGRANLPSTTFPIGSITKMMVATSILQLQEKGKLSTEDSVAAFIPNFPNGRRIKLIHLLNHTSGIEENLFFHGKSKDMLKGISVKYPAGKKWDYNDINYFVLGLVVEKASGEPLHTYIQRNIFDKASMTHSGFMTQNRPVTYTSKGYLKTGDYVLPVNLLNLAKLFGCGDIYSTALDLCLFDEALLSGKLLTERSLKEMLTPGSLSKYGEGVYINGNMVYSRGVVGGWETLHVFFKDHTVMAILLNVRDKNNNIHQLASDIKNIIQ
ncbi:serine hydrolase domain-containing protein [Neobacillus cucumis]|uniref:Penicillin-binding protein n=1 Tax=Neobacillus cucumis TaxID=1740721 RepID=A0A2N5H7E4_9BACI|nr:serine hydrolase domain-containing protein [Neobacillus cucumis]PLS01439.1 penicillin-binding protein [Neobacillus cucumis]